MSVVSGPELTTQIKSIAVDRTFEALLLYANGNQYDLTTSYTTLIADEVSTTAGGYDRLEFTFEDADIGLFTNGASTTTKYITWVHNGNSESIIFDTILIVERIFAQPLPNYNVVAIQPLGLKYELIDSGDRARFAFRVNLKNK